MPAPQRPFNRAESDPANYGTDASIHRPEFLLTHLPQHRQSVHRVLETPSRRSQTRFRCWSCASNSLSLAQLRATPRATTRVPQPRGQPPLVLPRSPQLLAQWEPTFTLSPQPPWRNSSTHSPLHRLQLQFRAAQSWGACPWCAMYGP
ncbi:hypothetical protein B0F90DRAFT_1752144 [Multifurca ochricompacta]|uniref:Uncharacterized protein n=1 Tax=Multifurca ochricompacta TaxID=376703 RepID=A0AAD4M0P4_9AGAM|nr:hypothetical protein B0F90DRAFT_1752144 [Multifurca ochricompacta]